MRRRWRRRTSPARRRFQSPILQCTMQFPGARQRLAGGREPASCPAVLRHPLRPTIYSWDPLGSKRPLTEHARDESTHQMDRRHVVRRRVRQRPRGGGRRRARARAGATWGCGRWSWCWPAPRPARRFDVVLILQARAAARHRLRGRGRRRPRGRSSRRSSRASTSPTRSRGAGSTRARSSARSSCRRRSTARRRSCSARPPRSTTTIAIVEGDRVPLRRRAGTAAPDWTVRRATSAAPAPRTCTSVSTTVFSPASSVNSKASGTGRSGVSDGRHVDEPQHRAAQREARLAGRQWRAGRRRRRRRRGPSVIEHDDLDRARATGVRTRTSVSGALGDDVRVRVRRGRAGGGGTHPRVGDARRGDRRAGSRRGAATSARTASAAHHARVAQQPDQARRVPAAAAARLHVGRRTGRRSPSPAACAPFARASSRQMPRSLRIQSTAKPKSNLSATIVLPRLSICQDCAAPLVITSSTRSASSPARVGEVDAFGERPARGRRCRSG